MKNKRCGVSRRILLHVMPFMVAFAIASVANARSRGVRTPISSGAFAATGDGWYISRDGHFSFFTNCLVTGSSATGTFDALNSLTPDTIQVHPDNTDFQVEIQGNQCGTHSAAWTGLIMAATGPAGNGPIGDQLSDWTHRMVQVIQRVGKKVTILTDTGVLTSVAHRKKQADFPFVTDTIAFRQADNGPACGVLLMIADDDTPGTIHVEAVLTMFNLKDPNLATVKSLVWDFLSNVRIWRGDDFGVQPALSSTE